MSLSSFSNLVSTHILGHGHAVFQFKDGAMELKRRSTEDTPVNKGWIMRTRLVAEGLPAQPYLHLDIRTPFGENVDTGQVESALAESLGPKKDRFAIVGWHIQFVEDTNLGSNHRVFVDLRDQEAARHAQDGMDSALPLEVAVEALAEAFLARHSEPNFQLLVGGPKECYSALFVNGSPFHVLRVREGAGEKAAQRLARHREYAVSQGKGSTFRTFLSPGDPLAACEAVRKLSPEIIDFNLRLPEADKAGKENGAAAAAPADALLYLHLGLALAASKRDYVEHNRVEAEDRLRNQGVRGRARFGMSLLAASVACLIAAGTYAFGIKQARSQARALTAKATAYQGQVQAIGALRSEKAELLAGLAGLKPLWSGPIPWDQVFADIAAALPAQSGVDGLTVDHRDDGSLGLSFRAWVKDWDAVRGIERKLSDSRYLAGVSISEQRKDLPTGAVVFHVSCRMEGR